MRGTWYLCDNTQEYEGSGIGLFVVKSLVEMHGAKISCISEQITNNKKEDCIEKINIEFSDIHFD